MEICTDAMREQRGDSKAGTGKGLGWESSKKASQGRRCGAELRFTKE